MNVVKEGDWIVCEIFITDLTDEARKQFEQVVGKNHNYDAFPIAEYYIEKRETETSDWFGDEYK